MLQNAYFLAKIGADTAENEQHFAENLPIFGKIFGKMLLGQSAARARGDGRGPPRAPPRAEDPRAGRQGRREPLRRRDGLGARLASWRPPR